jgi:pyridinium-3,5-biscarboxylic acid mononucleotide sulfurtransferase
MAVQPSSLPEYSANLAEKRAILDEKLRSMAKLLVAYSGGVDSAFLAYASHQVLGADMLAILADSPSLARTQLKDAIAFAEEQRIPLEVIATAELDRPEYARNDAFRCFHCKDELFEMMEKVRAKRGFDAIAYGVNADDMSDFRPGQKAAQLHHVRAPLLEAALSKSDIRELARAAGLRIWDKPASACLSSRIEYGRPVTREALSAIERGEDALRELGFRQFRVRHHGQIVRLEIAADELSNGLTPAMAKKLAGIFKGLGFTYVTLDLEGFRSGSMNALLPAEQLAKIQPGIPFTDGAKCGFPPAQKPRRVR